MLWDCLLFVRLRNYENEKYFLGKNLVTKLGPTALCMWTVDNIWLNK